MSAVVYRRVQHAAHYAYGRAGGHDLEQWIFAAGQRPSTHPQGIPSDAIYDFGFLESGVQHWVYTRTAPLSGPKCERCAGAAS